VNYNATISVRDITDESGPIVYPVTLPEMKSYLRLSNWEDLDDSPPTFIGDFNYDDILITDMIVAATELIEELAGISITYHEKEAVITNLCGGIEIAYGPVIGISSLTDNLGNVIDPANYTIVGNLWKFLKHPCYREMTITYTAGYDDINTERLPRAIRIDIMKLVAFMYENRGEEAKIQSYALGMAMKYSRNLLA
jgi:hypothetical protein